MPASHYAHRRHAVLALGAAILLVVLPAAAAAVTPVRGGSYKGALNGARSHIKVSFKVSKNGKSVTGLKTTDLPFYCSGGGPAVPITFKNATIGKSGTFRSTGKQIISTGPLKGQVGATLSITGKFLKGRKESGTIKTVFPRAAACNGSDGYSTKA